MKVKPSKRTVPVVVISATCVLTAGAFTITLEAVVTGLMHSPSSSISTNVSACVIERVSMLVCPDATRITSFALLALIAS